MKFLNTKLHGYVDYIISIVFLFIPSMLHLEAHIIQSLLFYIFAVFILFLSLQTDYEAGLYKVIPVQIHLCIELLAGLFFGISPWIFGFAQSVFLPYLFFGALIIAVSLSTKTKHRIRLKLF